MVWAIFLYSVLVAAVAGWAAVRIGIARPGTPDAILRDEYGPVGLIVSLVPASVLLLAGLSLFLLRRWTIWPFGVTVLILVWSVYLGFGETGTSSDVVWLAVTVSALAYAIWLRRRGTLR